MFLGTIGNCSHPSLQPPVRPRPPHSHPTTWKESRDLLQNSKWGRCPMSRAIGNLKQNLAHSLEEYSKNPWSWNLETKANSGALPDTADLFSWFPPYFSSDFHEGATSGNRLLRGSFLNSKSLEIYLAVVFLHPFLGMDSDAWNRESRIPKSSLLVSILLVFSSFLLNPHQWKYQNISKYPSSIIFQKIISCGLPSRRPTRRGLKMAFSFQKRVGAKWFLASALYTPNCTSNPGPIKSFQSSRSH